MANQALQSQSSVPFWRNVKTIALLLQIAFAIVVVLTLIFLYGNMMDGLARIGLLPSLGFLDRPANFAIQEGPTFSPSDPYRRAFIVGIANTVRVAVVGIFLATVLGFIVGIARLAKNWLLRNVAYAFIEIVRNIPLLVQLIFWYAVTRTFPGVADSINLFGLMFLNQRGVYLAWPRGTETFDGWTIWLLVALVAGIVVYVVRRVQLSRVDRPGTVLPWAIGTALLVAIGGFAIIAATAGSPLRLDIPELQKFNFRGGTELTPQFFALLTGLVIYTGAFIAEIVRGGILSIGKGQREAARALGLSEMQSLRLVVIPQALRVIIPPTTNQYLNLTKNSSLAIAIGYADLFYVAAIALNQTGQAVPIFGIIVALYLSASLFTSLLMNLYNRRIQIVER